MSLNPKKTVGLDIGSSVVKAVQLRKNGRAYELEKFGVAEIYPGVDKNSASIDRRDAKIEAVRNALNNAGITAKTSITSVSGESIIVRYIPLPDMPENELKGAIRWEAEDYIPFPLSEVNLDSMILGRNEVSGSMKVDVLLVAAKKDLIAEHVSLLKAVDLSPAIIDVESFAFLNCFEANYLPNPAEVVALINMGAEITSVSIYLGGVSRFSRDIAIAGDTITVGIQQRLNCSFPRAEELKIKEGAPHVVVDEVDADLIGGSSLMDTIRGTVERITGEDLNEESPEFIASAVIKSTLSNLCAEIRRSIQFYENLAGGKPVQRVILGGGSSGLKNIEHYFGQELGLAVEVIDPLRNIEAATGTSDRAQLDKSRNGLGVSIGLALRAFE